MNLTVVSSILVAVTGVSPGPAYQAVLPGLMVSLLQTSSTWNRKSSAVKGAPSDQRIPFRSSMVHSAPSSLPCMDLTTWGIRSVPAVFQRTGPVPLTRPELQLTSAGPRKPRRRVPPYVPISEKTGMTRGSSGILSSTGGSCPAATMRASMGDSP